MGLLFFIENMKIAIIRAEVRAKSTKIVIVNASALLISKSRSLNQSNIINSANFEIK